MGVAAHFLFVQLWDDIGATRGESWLKDLRFYLIYVPLILIAAGPLSMLVCLVPFSKLGRTSADRYRTRLEPCIISERYVETAADVPYTVDDVFATLT